MYISKVLRHFEKTLRGTRRNVIFNTVNKKNPLQCDFSCIESDFKNRRGGGNEKQHRQPY